MLQEKELLLCLLDNVADFPFKGVSEEWFYNISKTLQWLLDGSWFWWDLWDLVAFRNLWLVPCMWRCSEVSLSSHQVTAWTTSCWYGDSSLSETRPIMAVSSAYSKSLPELFWLVSPLVDNENRRKEKTQPQGVSLCGVPGLDEVLFTLTTCIKNYMLLHLSLNVKEIKN